MRTLPLLLALPLLACKDDGPEPQDSEPVVVDVDEDGDGSPASEDCDDNDPAVNPSAQELCDGLDNNCDGVADEGVTVTVYTDADGDGYGDEATAAAACAPAEGQATVAGDCNDADAAYYPGAPESDCADPNDYNCDGSVGYADNDGDGYPACEECDDGEAAVNPAAAEVCDGVDNNCSGEVDEGVTSTWYQDADGDGYGDVDYSVADCAPPTGYVADATDCDDGDTAVNPAAQEVCNTLDDDCDGQVDDADGSLDAGTATTWYTDGDGDGYGLPGSGVTSCTQPSGAVTDATDCDDGRADVSPAGTEVCDGADNDCDGSVDDGAADWATWYADADGDGYGDAGTALQSCEAPSGYVADSTDCDDSSAPVNPAATELCDGVDNNCDGSTDGADSSDAGTYYLDSDGDGYGDLAVSQRACSRPSGYRANSRDCDDSSAAVSPAATELCNTIDDDCDGDVDEASAADAATWYSDADGDGYGDPSSGTLACSAPSGAVADSTDCDDGAGTTYPGAAELCDGGDNDCDGTDDDGVLGTGVACPAASCYDALVDGRTTDGSYTLEGLSGAVFSAWCDQTRDGGGWTLIGSVVNDARITGSHKRSWNSYAVWSGTTTFGSVSARQTADYKGEAYADIPGDDYLVVTDEYSFGFYAVLGFQDFASFLASEYDSATCSTTFLASGADWNENLSTTQAAMFSFVVRPLDDNAGTCFPKGNENAILGHHFASCCWANGLGNTPSGYSSWIPYDNSLMQLKYLAGSTCTAGNYPCNDAGYYHSGTNGYTYDTKVIYAEMYVR